MRVSFGLSLFLSSLADQLLLFVVVVAGGGPGVLHHFSLDSLADSCGLRSLNLAGNHMLGGKGCQLLLSAACSHGNISLHHLNLSSCGLISPLDSQVLRLSSSSTESDSWLFSDTPTVGHAALTSLDLSFNELSVCDKELLSCSWQEYLSPRKSASRLEGWQCHLSAV